MMVVKLVVHHLKKMQSLQNYRSMVVIHILTPIWAAMNCEFLPHCPHMMLLPFPLPKDYHKEIKPDAAMLQMEVQCRYDVYGSCINGKAPCPKNWSKMKCMEFLNDFAVTIPQEISIEYARNEQMGMRK